MKASDYFKNMEEIQGFCETFKNQCSEEEYRVLLKVFGLGEQEGYYKEVPGIGKIDFSIADFVKALNDAGLTTLASCSGLQKDHPDWLEPAAAGYVCFLNTPQAYDIIKAATNKLNLVCEESETYLQPSLYIKIGGAEDTKEYLWKVLTEAILKEISIPK